MKRILPLIASALILCSTAFAARSGSPTLSAVTASASTVASGGTITLTVTLSSPVPENTSAFISYGSPVIFTDNVNGGPPFTAGSKTATAILTAKTVAKATKETITVYAYSGYKTVTLTVNPGTAPPLTYALTAAPTSVPFGNVTVGTTASQAVKLTNAGTGAISISGITQSGSTLFKLNDATAITTVQPGSSQTFTVTFSPTAVGALAGSVAIASNAASSPLVIPLTGTGAGVAALPTLTALACVPGTITGVGMSTCTATLSNAPTVATVVDLTSSNASATVPPDITVPAGSGMGIFTANAEAVTAATNVTLTAALNGTSKTFPLLLEPATLASYKVNLTWTAPVSSADPVAGYHVYRTISGGSSQLLTASLNVPTTYTDTTPAGGSTYTYEVTSVDANGIESSPSNPYTAAIP